MCNIDLGNFFDQVSGIIIHAGAQEFFPYILCGLVVGVHQVFGIKSVITQIIYYQFIRRKIIQAIELVNKMMHGLYQHGFAPVVLYHSLTQVTYGLMVKMIFNLGLKKNKRWIILSSTLSTSSIAMRRL